MRKGSALLVLGVLVLLAVLPAGAQAKNYPKDAYVVTAHVVAISVGSQGYRLTYLKSDNTWGNLFVPNTWFGGVVAKADLIYGSGPEYPFFSVFWVDGAFDHISIHAPVSFDDPAWKVLDPKMDLAAEFDVKEPPRDF